MPERKPLKLFAGTRLLGLLRPDGLEHLRAYAQFEETDAFDEVRELFRRQVDSPYSKEIREQLDALDLRIVDADGHEDRLLRIWIRGDRAMWRFAFLRRAKVANHDSCWKLLGEEVGPEECRDPGCGRLRILHSVFCRRHHFRMSRGEDYAGSFEDH